MQADAFTKFRDADRSKRLILEVAGLEFAEHGLGGARMARIAERANIDKKLIFYYFDNKERLYTEVLADAYAKIRKAESELHLTELDPSEAVCRLAEFTWNYYVKNPEFITFLNSENLHRARHIQTLPNIRNLNSPLVSMLGSILKRGEEEGTFKKNIDPIQLYISIAALSYFYLSNNYTLSAIFGRNLLSEEARLERLDHIKQFVLSYVTLPTSAGGNAEG
ncbi:TetR/AcrR family transcriptional regulator [Rhizobium sp. LC145]|uniref:TetR/AcrR family transcriptional regulator n=1 Tax=Rhizobium sp. LC145 TaxID=1120688 RepID=UPI00062A3894|nr:TetR/AcrR family transcriptional regulator [Rhizobium sp. LC145]KKX33287.1 TetR family transcriptional regulator [Rhizobium sp. LC145]TKT55836.1 TetR/AcrR family transcriptional regulator [Rhizobiaceae bacterium LC148]